MLAVTSFSPEGYEKYGHKCVKTLADFFPGRIVAYVEKELPDGLGVETRDFYGISGVNEYLERLKRQPGANGESAGQYDYRYDAAKFCRKVFAQDAVFDEDEFVFWFDSDCIILKDLTEQFMKSLVEGYAVSFLGRSGAQSYTETGWLGFNTKHPDFAKFRSAYLPYFTTGRIFSQLKGWHDCIAFDHARQGVKGRNLTPQAHGIGPVIQMSPLGPYMVHNKGNRKFK